MNLVTRGFLDDRSPRAVPRFSSVKRRNFRAWQVVRPIADLPTVVRGIASGIMKLRPRSVRYFSKPGQTATDLRYSFNEMPASYQSREYDLWSCHALSGHGSLIWEVVTQAGHDPVELNGMVRGGPRAYDGFRDLVRRFCAGPEGLNVRNSVTVFELFAPLAVRFDHEKVTSSPERVTVSLRAAADPYVAKGELHWTAGVSGKPLRHGSAKLSEREWTGEGGTLHAQLDIPIREGDASATLFILIGDRCVDCMSVPLAGCNPRMRAHNALDPDGHRLVEKLRVEEWRNARKFEVTVGLLLFYLGFQVDPLCAQKGLGNAVDHLAHDPGSSIILAVECTVGPPDGNGKLSKLIARSEDIRKKLPDSEVMAVLATARPRGELSKADVEKAERDDVALLAQEDLHGLWTAAQAGETSTQAVRRLRDQLRQVGYRRALKKHRRGMGSLG